MCQLVRKSRTSEFSFSVIPQVASKTGKQRCNKGNIELYCLFIAADGIRYMPQTSYAWPFTSVCMEWDRSICRRCAGRPSLWLAVTSCVQLTVDNSSFLTTDHRLLAEKHSPALARLRKQSFCISERRNAFLGVTPSSVRLKPFCFLHTDTAHGAH